jgi:Ca2+-binding EF-hand superfamily protein
MFTGVVVENFSYVFQASGSGSNSISREQMRSFKKIWAEFANRKTGYLERNQFAKFFSVRLVSPSVWIYVDFPISEIEWSF